MAFHRVDTASGVVYFCSDKIPARHGFASRLGGVSANIHTSSLNQAEGRGDSDEIVAENRRRFLDSLGLDPDSLVSLSQIHSSRVIYAPRSVDGVSADIERGSGATHDAPPNSQPLGSNTADTNADSREGDGLYTDISGVALGVKTADCVPILLYAPDVPAVAAIHAGWRGTVAGIAAVGCEGLVSLGAKPENIIAAIGPAICYDCYTVGTDLYETAAASLGERLASEYIYMGEDRRLRADLKGLNRRLMCEFGLRYDNIDVSALCTCHLPGLFFSHRFSHGRRGTMLSVISL